MTTTAEQQLALELINRARLDPVGEFDEMIANADTQTAVESNVTQAIRFFDVDLDLFLTQLQAYDSVPPLAWNENLEQSASTHTDLMIQYDSQSHQLPGESGLADRMREAGYDQLRAVGESIYAYSYDVEYAHAGFYIDWGYGPGGIQDPAGHRDAILNGTYTEVGIDWTAENNSSTQVGPYLTTQHFGTRFNYEAQLLGVVTDDADRDDFYDIGEGLGGITVQAVGDTGTFVTTTWSSGGYQMVLPDGVYTVSFSGTGLETTVETQVTIAGDNVKFDVRSDEHPAPPEPEPEPGQIIDGDAANNDLTGSAGADEIRSLQGDDIIRGGEGNDQIWGASGDDTIYGESDDDFLRGGPDEDMIEGGEGNDTIRGQKHSDDLFGGAGDDNVKGGGGNDEIYGGDGNDFLTGGTRFDVIDGGAGNDTISGNAHDDTLSGGAGADTLNGGGGDDRLAGGTGNDNMKGGSGADTFVFMDGDDEDVVTDFDVAEDRLSLDAAVANGATAQGLVDAANKSGGDVVFDFGGGDILTLENVSNYDALILAIDIA